ncbi:hypothetical protein [Streptomyces sp. AC555_RSS877]|nr:hypothetical protein [Streptomyces sp. AC555_RSS877]
MADRYLRFTGTAPGPFPTCRPRLPHPAALVRVRGRRLPGA